MVIENSPNNPVAATGDMTAEEAASYLGVSANRVYFLIERQRLKVTGCYKRDPKTRGKAPYMIVRESVERYRRLRDGTLSEAEQLVENPTIAEAARNLGISAYLIRQGIDAGLVDVVDDRPVRVTRQSVIAYAQEREKHAGRPIRLDGFDHLTIVSFVWRHRTTRAALERSLEEIFLPAVRVEITSATRDAERHRPRTLAILRSKDHIPARTVLKKLERAAAWISDPKVQWSSGEETP